MAYRVKEIVSVYLVPTLRADFSRRSAAEAWLIDYLTGRHLTVICREVDDENDAIDFMTNSLRQFAVEPMRGEMI